MRVKGTAIRSRLEFVKGRPGGDAALDQVLAALSPQDRRALQTALPTSWIPIELVDRLDVEIARHVGGADVGREYGVYSARRNLTQVYKVFVDQAGGDALALLHGLAPLHSSFYDQGSMRTVDPALGSCRVEIDFAGSATRFRCQVSLGFIEEALRMLDVQGLQVREESCQVRGALRCSISVSWSADAARRAPRHFVGAVPGAPSPS